MRFSIATRVSVLTIATILVTAASLGGLAIGNIQRQAAHRIECFREEAMARHAAQVRDLVEVAYSIVETHVALHPHGSSDLPTLQREVLEELRSLRYADGNYYWVNDMQVRVLMHPYLPHLEGRSQVDFHDPDGVYLFREFVEVAREHGEGLVQYRWPRPGGEEPVAKLSFVKLFAPWDWVIGTGVYVDDIEMAVAAETYRVETEVRSLVLRTGALTAGLTAFSLCLVAFISRRFIATPLQRAVDLVRSLPSDGSHRFQRLPEGRGDEIGALHSAINGMLSKWERMGDSLLAQRKFAEDLIGCSAVAAFVLGPDHRVLLWNEACEQLTGHPAAGLVGTRNHWQPFYGKPVPTLADAVLDGDFQHAEEQYDVVRPSVLASDGMHGERWIHPPGGTHRYIVFDAVPIRNAAGETIAVVETLQDISELKRTQEDLARLATAVEHAAESIVVTDPQGRITYANPAFELLTGYDRKEAQGSSLPLLQSGQLGSGEHGEMLTALRTGQQWHGHLVSRRCDGTLFDEIASIAPVHGADGSVTGFVTVQRDVTRERVLEKQLRQAQKMEAVGTMAAGIAHEFNNLLMAITGFTELTLEELTPASDAHHNLEQSLAAAGRARDLVAQMAIFSRQLEEDREVLSLQQIIGEAVNFLRPSLPTGIAVRSSGILTGDLVSGDVAQLRQLFINLVTNAAQAMPGDTGHITLRVDAVQWNGDNRDDDITLAPGAYLRVAVSDDGSGMTPDIVEQVFDPFFTTREVGDGTGLGLSVVHGVVLAHSGAVAVHSEPQRGSTFHVYLPQVPSGSHTAGPTAPV